MEIESSKSEEKQMGGKRKRKKVDWFVHLPDEIFIDILKRVPDVFLRYKAKYVCTRWFKIITNRILLDHASFILQKSRNFQDCLVDIREEEEEGLQVKEEYLDIPDIGMIRSWCNEFLLISDHNNLYVYNLITKERSYLPQCEVSCGGHHGCECGVTLCFDGFKGIYKVIHLFKGPPLQFEILVLRRGIATRVSSNWKKIKVPYMNEGLYCESDPVSVDGRYLHWDVFSSNYLISMDVVKEKISQTGLPGSGYHIHRKFFCSSFVMGGKLAKIEKVSIEKAEIWILKDCEKKKWEKLQSVTFQNFLQSRRYSYLYPVCGVISKRYIILEYRPYKRLFSYDLKDGVVKELDHIESYDHCVVKSSAPSFI